MKKHLLAVCLAASVPMLAACATTGAETASSSFGNAAAYQQAQTDVQTLTAQANQDPLLKPWTGPHGGVPPWDQARAELIAPALDLGIRLQEAEVQTIANNPERPTFDNTIGAMQDSGRHLDRATTIFGVMTDNISNEQIQAVEAEWSPRLTAAYNAITFNRALFNRIHDLYERRASLGLNAHQMRLLERTHDQFVRAGAAATPVQQARLGAINEELSSKYADFGRRLLADENTAIFITNRRDLAGLPPNIVEQLAAAAAERGHPGQWAVVNTRSSVDPFLTFASNRALRERVYTAFKNRGDNGDANDTNQVIADILRLRAERAQILGFQNHAFLRMADTMAGTPERAQDLMMRVWPAAVARVHEEVRDMQAIADRQRANITIEPWDYNYYAEQVRRDRYNLDQNELRPYFELNHMIEASQYMAHELYGLSFREITGTVPVFEPSVRVWEVTDRDGSFRGLFYGDYFARAGKRSGAWMNTYRSHETFTGTTITTLASNNNNFVHGANG
ncbi:MAG: M3 family metallopeptidase [Hyphomonadaceae bacterium]